MNQVFERLYFTEEGDLDYSGRTCIPLDEVQIASEVIIGEVNCIEVRLYSGAALIISTDFSKFVLDVARAQNKKDSKDSFAE